MQAVVVGQGLISYWEENASQENDQTHTPYVLLHGIGSSSGSWHGQIQAAKLHGQHLLAWDAPGYGKSTGLPQSTPNASDYATQLWAWLDAIHVMQPIHLVGHSLGALIATSAALLQPTRIAQLVLLSPALGYASSSVDERNTIIQQRLKTLSELGPAAMAKARAPAMLSKKASSDMIRNVEALMAAVHPMGYEQAVRMLANADLIKDLQTLHDRHTEISVRVACGSEDLITPAAKCAQAASAVATELIDLGPVGHACAIEAVVAVNQLLGLTILEAAESKP
jgi:pimeloyl-ACP methyl ester carboxylesterase